MNVKNDFMGVTFFELLIVILAVAILATVVVVNAKALPSLKLESAARKMVSDIRYAQHLAFTRQVDSNDDGQFDKYGIMFNPAGNEYAVFNFGTSVPGIVTDPATRTPMIINYTNDSTYKGVILVRTEYLAFDTLKFDYTGRPFDANFELLVAARIILQVGTDDIITKTVIIEPVTGMVKYE